MRIFISYRREDSAGHTGRLFDSLRRHFGDDSVFLDLSNIDSGQNFGDTIRQAIRSADIVLAIIGPEWLTCERDGQRRLDDPNDLVRAEITTALANGVPVIPVLVNGTVPPAEPVLPDPLRPLARRDAHDITDERWTYDVERLIAMMERLVGPKARPASSRWMIAAMILALAVAVGAAIWLYPRTRGTSVAPDEPVADLAPPAAQAVGTWTAVVNYPWNAQHEERFIFEIEGAEVIGTASFLRVPRGIVNGTVEGDRIRFETRTEDLDGTRITHHYRGRVTPDAIAFTMQSEGGGVDVPITFTASRAGDRR